MMNEIFEVIEAIKIFDLNSKQIDIIIHPKSTFMLLLILIMDLQSFLAHDTTIVFQLQMQYLKKFL